MSLTDLLFGQMLDPFRIGLLIALFATMLRTQATTGTLIPLMVGIVFVAVIIPVTFQTALPATLWQVIAVGVLANALIVLIIRAVWALYLRIKQ